MSKNFFTKLLLRDDGTSTPEKVTPQVTGNQENTVVPVSASPTLVDDFVERLQKLIEDNNQPGFDFLEFLETLFETSKNPGAPEYTMVFKIAQKMQASLSVPVLLESARTYKKLVESAANSTVIQGQQKKETLIQQKERERASLQTEVQTTTSKADALQKEVDALRESIITKSSQLAAIDQEYEPQFAEIDSKIAAMNTAKEQVIASIVDVEAGIQNYVK